MPITPTNPFKGRQHPGELILLCVRWYLRKLVKIKPADVPGPETREAPEWYETEIEIQSVEKGQLPGKKLTFLFTRSLDIRKEKALRLTSEHGSILTKVQQGIWILHRN